MYLSLQFLFLGMILEKMACPRMVITYIVIVTGQFNTFDHYYPLKNQ